jgi:hypothetical protein
VFVRVPFLKIQTVTDSRFWQFNVRILSIYLMSAIAEKHENTIDEAIARLLSRAADSRLLEITDVRGRVEKSVEKYLLRDNPNASSAEIKTSGG